MSILPVSTDPRRTDLPGGVILLEPCLAIVDTVAQGCSVVWRPGKGADIGT